MNKRFPEESFEDYKDRRKKWNDTVKKYLKHGRLLWVSCKMIQVDKIKNQWLKVQVRGTYIKKVHGLLISN